MAVFPERLSRWREVQGAGTLYWKVPPPLSLNQRGSPSPKLASHEAAAGWLRCPCSLLAHHGLDLRFRAGSLFQENAAAHVGF